MRTDVLDKIKNLGLSGYNVSNEFPYDDGGNGLYLFNPKTIYVDSIQSTEEPLVTALDGTVVNNSLTSVTVYFSVDAKNVPANYTSTVDSLRGIKDTVSFDGSVNRNCVVSTTYENDLLVSQVEYNFNRVKT
jgi:hypothetical protein